MILNNLTMAGTDEPVHIRITDSKITAVSKSAIDAVDALTLTFDKAIVFPGLINSHDHLDFNLFPQFGDSIYSNYTEWGNHIHKKYKDNIAAILTIPTALRAEWGVFKNLLCGVTTVVDHGEPAGLKDVPVTIFYKAQCLHSVHFQKRWRLRLNNPFKINTPVNIHVGEGDDWLSFSEIDQLTRWNLLGRKLIGVHAVAMSEEQAGKFRAVVWCPQSNYFLLGKTARINLLKKHTEILFGTDSTLTGSWDIWEHVRQARQTAALSDEALYQTLNQNAAKTWELNCGELKAGNDADITIARVKKHTAGFDSFFETRPADILLVIHQGRICLFDESLQVQLSTIDHSAYSKIYINGVCKYVLGNLPGLMDRIREYYPAALFPVCTAKAA
jgi:cytosine/adenosine deaminase-related metal-dependent hydrolase